MLTKFAVTNYRGFANRIEWDLSKSANYEFNKTAVKDGIIKNGIISVSYTHLTLPTIEP